MTKAFGAVALVALAFAGVALAMTQGDSYKVSTTLRARAEVPRPTGVPAAATGSFAGTAVELANDKARVTWKLTYSHLSGKAIAAHIHLGKPGKPGPVALALCGPCRSGQRGTGMLTHAQFARVEAGNAYVNIHTVKNAGGEIRGQIKVSEATGSGGSGSPPPPTETTPTTPYP
jgi:CHRD domain-containing protein